MEGHGRALKQIYTPIVMNAAVSIERITAATVEADVSTALRELEQYFFQALERMLRLRLGFGKSMT
jgi:hypothetical protein